MAHKEPTGVRELPVQRHIGRDDVAVEGRHEAAGPSPETIEKVAIGAVVVGALAVGVLTLGVVAIGRVALGRLGRRRVRSLTIDDLDVGRLRVGDLVVDRWTRGSRVPPPRRFGLRGLIRGRRTSGDRVVDRSAYRARVSLRDRIAALRGRPVHRPGPAERVRSFLARPFAGR